MYQCTYNLKYKQIQSIQKHFKNQYPKLRNKYQKIKIGVESGKTEQKKKHFISKRELIEKFESVISALKGHKVTIRHKHEYFLYLNS